MSGRVWLVLADPLSARVFVDCGITDRLEARYGTRLQPVFLFEGDEAAAWSGRFAVAPLFEPDLAPGDVPPLERVVRRGDRWLDERIGYYPLAIRLNYRHGFHVERMEPGHRNWLLDSSRAGPLPRWDSLERGMRRWHFSPRRYVPHALSDRLGRERPAVVFSNLQMQAAVPYIVAARRLRLTLVGYVASWDHTVGKGVISPHLDRYIVQNAVMRDDLERYHGIPRDDVVVTGWPQTDVFHDVRPRSAYESALRSYGLDPSLPLVMVMGNTPTNAPYEGRFVERLVAWRSAARESVQLLFRPHPRDRDWHERFASALVADGCAVQEPSYTDLELLASLLRHCDAVVANAGTILLDALVNDRPAVCVLYDEGAPPGESWAAKNVVGEHYRDLVRSGAFLRAETFDDVIAGIRRCLAAPAELAEERRRVVASVVGDVDGHAAERVVEAIANAVD
ncbi:MAG: CDP-glycerol glycerophosphotransferase family protein [Gaiellaceae bacterium]